MVVAYKIVSSGPLVDFCRPFGTILFVSEEWHHVIIDMCIYLKNIKPYLTIVYWLISEIDGGRDYSCLKSEIDRSHSSGH